MDTQDVLIIVLASADFIICIFDFVLVASLDPVKIITISLVIHRYMWRLITWNQTQITADRWVGLNFTASSAKIQY